MSMPPQRPVQDHLDPEKVAYWYFRLNGFFRGGKQTDADLLGVRFPHRAERLSTIQATGRGEAGEVLTEIARSYNVSHSTISRLG
jgi:hypothetical protein